MTVVILSMMAMKGLLPDRKPADDDRMSGSEHLLQVFVSRDNSIVGKALTEAGLNDNPACRIIEITRFDNYVINNVADDEFFFGGDTILLAGSRKEMQSVASKYGLKQRIQCQTIPERPLRRPR